MKNWNNLVSKAEEQEMHPDTLAILKYFEFDRLPVEDTFLRAPTDLARKSAAEPR